MTAQDRTTLKGYFETGDIPTQTQFANFIDSMARAGNNTYATSATSDLVIYPGASGSAPQLYAGSMSYIKAESSAEICASIGLIGKGRNGANAASINFGVSGNYGREIMMYLETTGVLATCNRQVSFEPGFTGTGQHPSIRAEGLQTFATDPNIPFGVGARGSGYVGFFTHGNGGAHGEAQADVLQAMVSDTSGGVSQVQLKGGVTGGQCWVGANSGLTTNVGLTLSTQGNGYFSFQTDGKTYSRSVNGNDVEQFRITHTASADNILLATGADGAVPSLRAFSSANSNVSLGLISQGTGNVNCYTNSGTLIARFTHTANAVNFVDITGSVSASPVRITANGEADVNIFLVPRGSAFVQHGTFVADAGINVVGYYKQRTADGVIRRIAVVSGT